MENLCNLDKLVRKRFTYIALPLKISGETGDLPTGQWPLFTKVKTWAGISFRSPDFSNPALMVASSLQYPTRVTTAIIDGTAPVKYPVPEVHLQMLNRKWPEKG